MKIIQNLADPSRYSVKCPYAMTPTRVVVHNTANDAPAANEIAYMIRNDNEVSFHYAVDDQEVVQGVPEHLERRRRKRQRQPGGDRRGDLLFPVRR